MALGDQAFQGAAPSRQEDPAKAEGPCAPRPTRVAEGERKASLSGKTCVSRRLRGGRGFVSCPFISLVGRVTCPDNQKPEGPLQEGKPLSPWKCISEQ